MHLRSFKVFFLILKIIIENVCGKKQNLGNFSINFSIMFFSVFQYLLMIFKFSDFIILGRKV